MPKPDSQNARAPPADYKQRFWTRNIYLTLGDRNTLNETVDIWGDGLYISKGLFIPFSLAWKGLEEYLIYHKLSNKINWITSDEVPEEGNFIC